MGCQPSESPENHGDMGSEDSPQGVDLIHHHVREAMEEVRPAIVEREDGDVQHVGVGEDHVGSATNTGPLVVRRVSVIDRCSDFRQVESIQRSRLVLCKGLGRVDEQRGPLGVLKRGFDDRDLEAKRLAGGRACGQHDMVAGTNQFDGLHLMAVEPVDPTLGQASRDNRGDIEVSVDRGSARVTPKVNELPIPVGIVRPGLDKGARVHPVTIEDPCSPRSRRDKPVPGHGFLAPKQVLWATPARRHCGLRPLVGTA